MEIQKQNRLHLETIQEEDELQREDEFEEEEEENIPFQVGQETEEFTADEGNEDVGAPLRVPTQMFGFHGHGLKMQSKIGQRKKMKNSSMSYQTTHTGDVNDGGTSPGQPRSPKKKPSGRRKPRFEDDRFPQWVIDLMFNIEEATTHQLVVE